MPKPIIAIPADIREFDGTHWHAAQNQYVRAALKVAGVMSFIIPAFEDGNETDALLDRVDGLLVSGSATNVHPALYGAEARDSDGPFDPARDATTLPLIRRAIERGIPLFAICRGIQELNVALGGTLASEIQEQEGVWDHRKPQHDDRDVVYSIRQDVIVVERHAVVRVESCGRSADEDGVRHQLLQPCRAVQQFGERGFQAVRHGVIISGNKEAFDVEVPQPGCHA